MKLGENGWTWIHIYEIVCVFLCVPVYSNSNILGFSSEKKNYFGAQGGPRSVIFDTIDLDPLYFEVHIFSASVKVRNCGLGLHAD